MKDKDILLDIVQRLSRIEEKVNGIEKHTETMNRELGECRDCIEDNKKAIEKFRSKFFMKLSWKQLLAFIGGVSTLVVIIRTILEFFNIP
jgi:chromosome segregation ATPase